MQEELGTRVAGAQVEAARALREAIRTASSASVRFKEALALAKLPDLCVAAVVVVAVAASFANSDYIVLPFAGIGLGLCYAVARIAAMEAKTDAVRIKPPIVRGSANQLGDAAVFVPIEALAAEWRDWAAVGIETAEEES